MKTSLYGMVVGADYEVKEVYKNPEKQLDKKTVQNILFLSLIAPIFLAPSIVFKMVTDLIKDLFSLKNLFDIYDQDALLL